jgi:hypothetical protein
VLHNTIVRPLHRVEPARSARLALDAGAQGFRSPHSGHFLETPRENQARLLPLGRLSARNDSSSTSL